MASNLRRSKRTVGRRILDLQTKVSGLQKRVGPVSIGQNAVSTSSLQPGAVGGWVVDTNSIYTGTKTATGSYAPSGSITIGSDGHITANKFRIDANGDAFFTGAISGGTIDIGGFDTSSFHVDANGNMWLGAGTFGAATFTVTSGGVLSATGASISGVLTAGSGSSIGGWVAETDRLSRNFNATDYIRLTPSSDTSVGGINIVKNNYSDISLNGNGLFLFGPDPLIGAGASWTGFYVDDLSTGLIVSSMTEDGVETPSIITPNAGLPFLNGRISAFQLTAADAIAKVGFFNTGGFSTMGISLAFGLSILTLSGSTRDIKRNIEEPSYSEVEDVLMRLNPVKFQYKHAPDADELTKRMSDEQVVYGFIAEEVAEVYRPLAAFMPKSEDWWDRETVTYETMMEDFKPSDWDQRAVTSLLVKGYQRTVERINDLESRLQALES